MEFCALSKALRSLKYNWVQEFVKQYDYLMMQIRIRGIKMSLSILEINQLAGQALTQAPIISTNHKPSFKQ